MTLRNTRNPWLAAAIFLIASFPAHTQQEVAPAPAPQPPGPVKVQSTTTVQVPVPTPNPEARPQPPVQMPAPPPAPTAQIQTATQVRPTTPAPPAPVVAPPAPAAMPAPQQAGELQTLQFLDVDATEILAIYEQLTGKILVRDQGLAGIKLYVDSKLPISKDDRIRLIEATLFLNGFTLIPDKGNMVRVIGPSKAPSVANQAIRLLCRVEDIPDSDDVVSYFMPLEYLDPMATQQLFQQLLQPPNPFAKVVAAPNAAALIVTDKGSIIHELIKLRTLIDVPPSRLATGFVQLERADAERVAMILNDVIESRNSATQSASRGQGGVNVNIAPQPQPPQNAPEALIQALARARGGDQAVVRQAGGPGAQDFNVLSRDTTLVADPRTNRILVITHPSNFEYIEALIREFDVAVELTKPFIKSLRYVPASEVMPILAEVLQEEADTMVRTSEGGGAIAPGAGGGTGTSRSGLTGSRTGTTGGSRASSSRSSTSSRSRSSPSGAGGRSGLTSGRSGGSGGLAPESGPMSMSIGKIRLISDDRSNTIMVMGPPESVTKVETILEQLDQRPKQVYLAVVIGRLAVGENLDYAADIFQKFYPNPAKGKSYGFAGSLRNRSGDAVTPNALNTVEDLAEIAIPGLSIYGSISKSIDAFLEVFESTTRFEIISRPSIYTANNRTASIINGERIAVPASTVQSDTGDNFRTNIEYEEIVLQIEVTPLINSENEITLQVYQLNENRTDTTTIDENEIPNIATQELSTEITVANRSTVLLGGLITTEVGDDSSGLPFFHRIPIIGGLFGGKSQSGRKTELVILIQPIVLDTDAETMHNTVVEMDQTQMGYKWLEANSITNATRGPNTLIETMAFEEAERRRLIQQQSAQPHVLPTKIPVAKPIQPQPAATPAPAPAASPKNGPRGKYSPISTKHGR